MKQRLDFHKEKINELEKSFVHRKGSRKPIEHYLLFWWRGETDWATLDWGSAQAYIGKFHPTCGFSQLEAINADRVTIIGAPSGVPHGVEDYLEKYECQVERLDGKTFEHTAELLKQRVHANTAFMGGPYKLGY